MLIFGKGRRGVRLVTFGDEPVVSEEGIRRMRSSSARNVEFQWEYELSHGVACQITDRDERWESVNDLGY